LQGAQGLRLLPAQVGRDYIKIRAAKMAARHHAQKMRGE
jgi:hypothetical protein